MTLNFLQIPRPYEAGAYILRPLGSAPLTSHTAYDKLGQSQGELVKEGSAMSLKPARALLLAFCGLMCISLLLRSATKEVWLGYLGIGFAMMGAALWVIFGRCPSCRHFLGRAYVQYCSHCGAKIPW